MTGELGFAIMVVIAVLLLIASGFLYDAYDDERIWRKELQMRLKKYEDKNFIDNE